MPEPVRLKQHLRIETIGDEVVVFDRDSGESISRLTGDAVEALRLLQAAQGATSLPERLSPAVAELAGAGIVEHPGWISRRDALIKGGKAAAVVGAAWTAASVTSFRLADPAMAASPCPNGNQTDPAQQTYTASGTYTTWSGVNSLLVRCWGAGGGGGGGHYTFLSWGSGAGGGGGAYAHDVALPVSPCTTYVVTVGTGGQAGGTGGAGGNSSFNAGASALVLARGGGGGSRGVPGGNAAAGAGGSAATSIGGTRLGGGNGGIGGNVGTSTNVGGGGGGGASTGGVGANGGDHNATGGAGGQAAGTQTGGAGGGADNNGGLPGGTPGGGGGAGYGQTSNLFNNTSTPGGAGARGEVWVGH